MRRLDLKDSLRHAANNFAELSALISDISPIQLIQLLCAIELPVFNQIMQTLYGEPDSRERAFFKEFTHTVETTLPALPVDHEDYDSSFDDKQLLYVLWTMVCPLNEIDYQKLKAIRQFFFGIDMARINYWLRNVYQYFNQSVEVNLEISGKDVVETWEEIPENDALIPFINNMLDLRKTSGADKIYLNLAATDLRDMPLIQENYNFANLDCAHFSPRMLYTCTFVHANLKHANFSKCMLSDCDLSFANLQGADFSETTFDNMNLSHVDFTHAKLTKARFVNCNFFDVKIHFITQTSDFIKYENHPDFDILRAAILDSFIENTHRLRDDIDKIRYFESALKCALFGKPRTEARRNFNQFFASKHLNYAENSIYTSSQRRIRSEIKALRKKVEKADKEARKALAPALESGREIIVFTNGTYITPGPQ